MFAKVTTDKGLLYNLRKNLLKSLRKQTAQFKKKTKNLKGHFTKEDIQIGSKPMKICSQSHVRRDFESNNEVPLHGY